MIITTSMINDNLQRNQSINISGYINAGPDEGTGWTYGHYVGRFAPEQTLINNTHKPTLTPYSH